MNPLDECEVTIRRQDGKIIAGVPELNLFASADTVDAAIELLAEKKRQLADHVRPVDALGRHFSPKQQNPTRGSALNDIQRFAIKSAIAAAAVALCIVVIEYEVEEVIDHTAAQFEPIMDRIAARIGSTGGKRFWTTIGNDIERYADSRNDLTEDKKALLLKDIRVIVERWRPFVAEAARLFQNPDEASVPQQAK